jgi:hypothetical protein
MQPSVLRRRGFLLARNGMGGYMPSMILQATIAAALAERATQMTR